MKGKMEATTQHPLQPFTDGNVGTRYALGAPWYVDGLAFATDGRIAAWMPSEPFETPTDGRKPSRVSQIISEPAGLDYQPMPLFEPCALCSGKLTVIREKCEHCDGKGRIAHECDCELCTEQYERCYECGGKGKFTGADASVACECFNTSIRFLGSSYALGYLHKIAALGDVVCAVDFADTVKSLWFKVGEIRGRLAVRQM